MTKKTKTYATHVTTPTGERIYVRGNTPEERDRKVTQVKARCGLGMGGASTTTFEEFATLWLDIYKPESSMRPTSYAAVKNTFFNHVLPAFGKQPIDSITPMNIQKFKTQIGRGSASQAAKSWQMAKAIFASAVDNHLITESPIKSTDKLPAAHAKEEEEPLTDEQVKRLLDAVKGSAIELFVLIALTTGMRKGEIMGLMWDDVDLVNGVIEVRHNKSIPGNLNDCEVTSFPKTDAGRRRIPIPTKLLDLLKHDYTNRNSDFVFAMPSGQSYTKSAFRAAWAYIDRRTAGKRNDGKGVGEKYGDVAITLDFTTHPHQLRHTYITKLFEQGLDIKQVQYLAGHSTPDMTMRVYTHYRSKQREADTAAQVMAAIDYI
ncbi:MAG: site-specific integrase [Clostridia bacterium]|nr:site-specific integrase [Clostridia bacterium]